MSGVNKVILLGRLGKDPELRKTQKDEPVANFSMATSENWTDKEGKKQEKTEWHNVVLWGRLAEIADKYLKKGKQVYIEGKLQTRQWEDKDGNKRYTTEIVGLSMQLLGSKEDGGGNRAPHPAEDSGGGPGGDEDGPL